MEEELLLVDGVSGQPLSVAAQVLRRRDRDGSALHQGLEQPSQPGGSIGGELQQQQLETDTHPCEDLADLEQELRTWRARAIQAAANLGASVAAVGTPPVPAEPKVDRGVRYQRMREKFGLTSAESLTCGCHVHVGIDSAEEGVAILDRIRPWLPALLALSGNSPFWQGQDSSYASFRSQVLVRWPSAGPSDIHGSVAGYRALVEQMVASGVLLDEGMVYFDARLAHDFPTVEIRVADVCLDVRDAVLTAGLVRALVETAAQEFAEGEPPLPVPTAVLRLAQWQAGRFGVQGDLLDPRTARAQPAADVLTRLVEHVRPALRASGDEELVGAGLARVLAEGTGSTRQRQVLERSGDVRQVVAEVVEVTAS